MKKKRTSSRNLRQTWLHILQVLTILTPMTGTMLWVLTLPIIPKVDRGRDRSTKRATQDLKDSLCPLIEFAHQTTMDFPRKRSTRTSMHCSLSLSNCSQIFPTALRFIFNCNNRLLRPLTTYSWRGRSLS